MRFLITGATGDVGSRVVRRLVELGERPRVLVRDSAKARMLFGEAVEIVIGDLADAGSLRGAMEGLEQVFLVNSGPRIPELDGLAAGVAKAAGVWRLVKLSSLDVEQSLAIGAWHELGEAEVRASGVPFTFIRPSGFFSNLLAWAHSVKSEGVVRSSTGNGRRPFIHSEDIAAVAVKVLTGGGYEGDVLALTGPEALTFGEVAGRIGAAIGKPVQFEAISDEEAERRFAATGASEAEVAAHVELWQAIREGQLGAVTDGVKRVLGREPMGIDQWIEENMAAFSPETAGGVR